MFNNTNQKVYSKRVYFGGESIEKRGIEFWGVYKKVVVRGLGQLQCLIIWTTRNFMCYGLILMKKCYLFLDIASCYLLFNIITFKDLIPFYKTFNQIISL